MKGKSKSKKLVSSTKAKNTIESIYKKYKSQENCNKDFKIFTKNHLTKLNICKNGLINDNSSNINGAITHNSSTTNNQNILNNSAIKNYSNKNNNSNLNLNSKNISNFSYINSGSGNNKHLSLKLKNNFLKIMSPKSIRSNILSAQNNNSHIANNNILNNKNNHKELKQAFIKPNNSASVSVNKSKSNSNEKSLIRSQSELFIDIDEINCENKIYENQDIGNSVLNLR